MGTKLYDRVPNHIKELDKYSRNNSTKSPASGTGNVCKPRLLSQIGTVHEVVCVCRSTCFYNQSGGGARICLVAAIVTEIGGPKVLLRGAVKVVMQNDWDFVDVILLHVWVSVWCKRHSKCKWENHYYYYIKI